MKDKNILGQAMQSQVKRRSVLKAGAAGVAGGMLMPGAARFAMAAEQKPLGAWPAGVEGDSVFVGLTVDLTGPYSAQGAEQKNGYELAAEQINAGAPQVQKISPLIKKGIMGKKTGAGLGRCRNQTQYRRASSHPLHP
jgi:Spy/CpxP family protein refolding chaperone